MSRYRLNQAWQSLQVVLIVCAAAGCNPSGPQVLDDYLVMDATERYLSVPAADLPVGDLTIEFWASPTPETNSEPPLEPMIDPNGGLWGQTFVVTPLAPTRHGRRSPGISVARNGVSVHELKSGSFTNVLGYSAEISDWTHLALVYANSKGTLYVNGQPVANTKPHADVLEGRFEIGHVIGNNHPYQGKLDEFRVWGRALTGKEVLGLRSHEIPAGRPEIHYDFTHQDDHQLIFDRSGNGRHASVIVAERLFGLRRADAPAPVRRPWSGIPWYACRSQQRVACRHMWTGSRKTEGCQA